MNHRVKLLSILSIALPFLLVFQTIAASANSTSPGDIRTDSSQTTTTVTFTPSTVSMSEPELVNPIRGWHEWRGDETVPQPETSPDAYARYFWRDPDHPSYSLETSRGVYNFSKIDADIAAAAAQGKKFAFRIRAMGNDTGGKRYVPDYLSDCGWSYQGTFIPDWNRSCFLDNARNLINALGARYNNDPRIAWMDIGMYGRWGEWAMSEGIYDQAPSSIDVVTDDSMIRIVDMQLNAFPNVRKVMFAKTRGAAVVRALSSSDKVGWRIDCLGKDGYFDFSTNSRYAAAWPYMQDRWKTAPVIVEFCANDVEATYTTAINQVRENHIVTIGNGNIDSWSSKNATQQANLITLGKTAGYRFKIKDVTVPTSWTPAASVTIAARWENLGVTPHYEATNVLYRLYNTASAVVWEGRSSLDLRSLLPTDGAAIAINDSLALPANLAAGSYQLGVIVTDPANYRKPLRLAIGGRQSDGSYLLGTVSVIGRAVQPTATAQPTGTATPLPTAQPTVAPTTPPTAVPTTPPTAVPTTPPPAGPQTTTYNPIADTYVNSSAPRENYGQWTTVRANTSPTEITYLRFDLRNLAATNVTQAKLRVRVSNGASDATTQNIKIVSSDSWGETTLTYNNRPSLSSASYGAFHGGSAGSWVEVDLTSLIRSRCGNVFSIAVVNSSTDSFAFYTRDSSNKPQLNIVTQGTADLGANQLFLPVIVE